MIYFESNQLNMLKIINMKIKKAINFLNIFLYDKY